MRPLCTGPGWTTVLRGAVSQRTRSPSGRPGQRALGACLAEGTQAAAHRVEVRARVEREQPGLVQLDTRAQVAMLLGVEDHARVHRLATLDPLGIAPAGSGRAPADQPDGRRDE